MRTYVSDLYLVPKVTFRKMRAQNRWVLRSTRRLHQELHFTHPVGWVTSHPTFLPSLISMLLSCFPIKLSCSSLNIHISVLVHLLVHLNRLTNVSTVCVRAERHEVEVEVHDGGEPERRNAFTLALRLVGERFLAPPTGASDGFLSRIVGQGPLADWLASDRCA